MSAKQIIPIVLSALLATGCRTGHETLDTHEREACRQMCEQLNEQYPEATLQDVYKTCYQDFFGAEHMMNDTAAARCYLEYELSVMSKDESQKSKVERRTEAREPTGFRHRYVRVSLQEVLDGVTDEEELLQLFFQAMNAESRESKAESRKQDRRWEREWAETEAIALEVQPRWRDEELQQALREAAGRQEAVHHSVSYRENYHPHYRIIINQQ